MRCEKWIFTLISLLYLTLISATVPYISDCDAYHCFNKGNYSSESLYRTNLHTLLRSLSAKIGADGFYTGSVGTVNVIALCRADVQIDQCRSCVDIIAEEIPQQCPYRMQAIRWSEYCMLRYSNESISQTLAEVPVTPLRSVQNVTSPARFKEVRETLFEELRRKVGEGSDRRKVAVGSMVARDDVTVYAMSQCTPNLSAEDCRRCLANAADEIPGCCENAMGARVYMPSCILRYESVPFFNVTRLEEPLLDSPPQGNKKSKTTRNVIIIVISIVMSVIFLSLSAAICTFMRKKSSKNQIMPTKEKDPAQVADDGVSTAESVHYDFEKIRIATDNFSDANKLGHGGFGAVYWGKLVNGREIAVKRLSRNSVQGDMEFKNEVVLVAKLQHRNLVRLLGFSQRGNEKLLIYEFVSNGSLDHFVFDPVIRAGLVWDMRYKIIRGIAKGLLYLHEDSRLRIIHRDLKASNILLDEEMNPKVSDFGMARMVVRGANLENTDRIVGTYGYMAPEYANHGQFSTKSDIFSFGVLILEIITGKKRIFPRDEDNLSEHLLDYAWGHWCDGMVANIIDPSMRVSSEAQQAILRCIHIALLCLQENASNRPTMASIILLLNGSSLPLPMPSCPAFSTPVQSQDSSLSRSSSITKLHPR